MLKYILSIFLLFTTSAYADTIVNEYTVGKAVPTNFSVPWNLFYNNATSLQGTDWVNDTVTVKAGSGYSKEYIYKTGYYYTGFNWVPFNFSGNVSEDPNWFIGTASSTTKIPLLNSGASSTKVIAFICNNLDGVWKCGCSNTACTTPAWTVQSIVDRPEVTTTEQCSASYNTPTQATSLGFTTIEFCDDFSDPNTVNVTSDSESNKWSRNRLSSWQPLVTTNPSSVYKFNTDGTLTVSPSSNALANLVTAWKDGTNKGYYTSAPNGYYVEFRWKHTDINEGSNPPVLWGLDVSHLWQNPYEKPRYTLPVVFKYLNKTNTIEMAEFSYNNGTNKKENTYTKSNTSTVDVTTFNTYGMLVTPTQVKWYVNNVLVDTCTQGSCSFTGFDLLPTSNIGWLIGAGVGVSYTLDYFRVFTN